MAVAVILPGNGERRTEARFELVTWALVYRADGSAAGKVLVTDISQNGFNMQSRWDFAASEEILIDMGEQTGRRSKVAWHDPVVGAYGCRFAQPLDNEVLSTILSRVDERPGVRGASFPTTERRRSQRLEMRVPVTARRGEVIESEVVVLTNLSMSGFRMRSSVAYEVKQTIYVELAPRISAEARIVRFDPENREYAACFSFALGPTLIDRLVAAHIAASPPIAAT